MKVQMRTRRGFTLIELVVVLLVLAGLAGMLVPVLQNMVQKTHGATGGANMNEVAKAIQMFEAQSGQHPNGYDSLIADGDIVGGDEDLELVELTADEAGKLEKIGITFLYDHDPESANQTFEPYAATPVQRTLSGSVEVATLNEEGFEHLGLTPTIDSKYVAFGVGALNTAIGKTMVAAPVHFPESGESPASEYSRFVVIYEIPLVGPARLATIAAFHDDHMSSLGNHLEEYYETQQF